MWANGRVGRATCAGDDENQKTQPEHRRRLLLPLHRPPRADPTPSIVHRKDQPRIGRGAAGSRDQRPVRLAYPAGWVKRLLFGENTSTTAQPRRNAPRRWRGRALRVWRSRAPRTPGSAPAAGPPTPSSAPPSERARRRGKWPETGTPLPRPASLRAWRAERPAPQAVRGRPLERTAWWRGSSRARPTDASSRRRRRVTFASSTAPPPPSSRSSRPPAASTCVEGFGWIHCSGGGGKCGVLGDARVRGQDRSCLRGFERPRSSSGTRTRGACWRPSSRKGWRRYGTWALRRSGSARARAPRGSCTRGGVPTASTSSPSPTSSSTPRSGPSTRHRHRRPRRHQRRLAGLPRKGRSPPRSYSRVRSTRSRAACSPPTVAGSRSRVVSRARTRSPSSPPQDGRGSSSSWPRREIWKRSPSSPTTRASSPPRDTISFSSSLSSSRIPRTHVEVEKIALRPASLACSLLVRPRRMIACRDDPLNYALVVHRIDGTLAHRFSVRSPTSFSSSPLPISCVALLGHSKVRFLASFPLEPRSPSPFLLSPSPPSPSLRGSRRTRVHWGSRR